MLNVSKLVETANQSLRGGSNPLHTNTHHIFYARSKDSKQGTLEGVPMINKQSKLDMIYKRVPASKHPMLTVSQEDAQSEYVPS